MSRYLHLIGIALLLLLGTTGAAERGTNLVASPSFENDSGWNAYASGFTIDPAVARSGRRSVRCTSQVAHGQFGTAQNIMLTPPVRTPIRVSGWSRAERAIVAGDYNIYVDVFYEDGTNLWGQRATFQPGSHDWERAEVVVVPEKPVRRMLVHALFRRSTGTVWFDDITVELLPLTVDDVQLAAGGGVAAARARISMASKWRATVRQEDRDVVTREGRGSDLRASWDGLRPGPAALRIEATDEFLGQAVGLTREFMVGVARPTPRVWTAHSLAEIGRDGPIGSDTAVVLSAGRGETEHVQIIITPQVDVSDIPVAVGELRGPGGAQLGTEHVSLRQVLTFEGVPDVLAPIGPLTLAAWTHQPIWLTARVPNDAAPGEYRGVVTIDEATVPVQLTVWDLTLPVRPSIPAVFGIADRTFARRYGLREGTVEWQQALERWYRFLIEYRMSPYFCKFGQAAPNHYSYPAPWPIGDPRTDEVLADDRLAASAVPYPLGGDRERLRASLDHLRSKGWLDRAYFYLWDEPVRTAQYKLVRQWASEIHAIAPEVRVLTSFFCGPKDGRHKDDLMALPTILDKATQIYCMSQWVTHGDENFRSRIEAKMRPGDEWWTYVCCGPGAATRICSCRCPGSSIGP